MRVPRLYHPEPLFGPAQTVQLTESAARHVSVVLRLAVNNEVILFNGDGSDYPAKIISLTKKKVEVAVQKKLTHNRESSLQIHLGQAISRGERMDWVMQKAVELGVQEITPLITAHCAININNTQLAKKLAHWQGIIFSACEQSGRNTIPLLHKPQQLTAWLTRNIHACGLVCDPDAVQTIKSLSLQPAAVSLLVGPEGGLSDAETALAKAQHFHAVKLSNRILRTETAAVAAISVLQGYWGDF